MASVNSGSKQINYLLLLNVCKLIFVSTPWRISIILISDAMTTITQSKIVRLRRLNKKFNDYHYLIKNRTLELIQ